MLYSLGLQVERVHEGSLQLNLVAFQKLFHWIETFQVQSINPSLLKIIRIRAMLLRHNLS